MSSVASSPWTSHGLDLAPQREVPGLLHEHHQGTHWKWTVSETPQVLPVSACILTKTQKHIRLSSWGLRTSPWQLSSLRSSFCFCEGEWQPSFYVGVHTLSGLRLCLQKGPAGMRAAEGHRGLRGRPDKEHQHWGDSQGLLPPPPKTQTSHYLGKGRRDTKKTTRKSLSFMLLFEKIKYYFVV